MKLKNLLGEYWLVTVLAVIALSMLIIRVVYTIGGKENTNIQATPTALPVVLTPTTSKVDYEKNYPLWQLLPFTGEGFVVEKYLQPLVLKVSIVKGEKVGITKKIVEWMEENGVNPELHSIVWE